MAALALKGWQEAGLCLDWYLIGGFGVPRCWIGGGIGAAWNKGTPPPLLQCFLSESVKLPVNLSPSGSTSSCVSEFVLVRALFCYMSEFFINLEWRRWMDDLRFQGAILVDALSVSIWPQLWPFRCSKPLVAIQIMCDLVALYFFYFFCRGRGYPPFQKKKTVAPFFPLLY